MDGQHQSQAEFGNICSLPDPWVDIAPNLLARLFQGREIPGAHMRIVLVGVSSPAPHLTTGDIDAPFDHEPFGLSVLDAPFVKILAGVSHHPCRVAIRGGEADGTYGFERVDLTKEGLSPGVEVVDIERFAPDEVGVELIDLARHFDELGQPLLDALAGLIEDLAFEILGRGFAVEPHDHAQRAGDREHRDHHDQRHDGPQRQPTGERATGHGSSLSVLQSSRSSQSMSFCSSTGSGTLPLQSNWSWKSRRSRRSPSRSSAIARRRRISISPSL